MKKDIKHVITRKGRLLIAIPGNSGFLPVALAKLFEHGWAVKEVHEESSIAELWLDHGRAKFLCRLGLETDTTALADTFAEPVFEWFDLNAIKEKVMMDIGANIGDTSIDFALKGASLVIALEPFTESYDMAIRNVALNGLENRIIMLNKAASGSNGKAQLHIVERDSLSNSINPILSRQKSVMFTSVTEVETTTVKSLMSNFGLEKIDSLKMNCEGCEYDIIQELSNEGLLSRIENISIHLHSGERNIPNLLSDAGFCVAIVPDTDSGTIFLRARLDSNHKHLSTSRAQ